MKYLLIDLEKLKKHYPTYENSKTAKEALEKGIVLSGEDSLAAFKKVYWQGVDAGADAVESSSSIDWDYIKACWGHDNKAL